MGRFLIGLVALLALVGVVIVSFAVVGELAEYNLRSASAIQITQVYSELTFGLLQSVVALLAIVVFVQIASFVSGRSD